MFNALAIRFLLLALLVAAANVIADAVAASLFLSKAGAESIPVFYLLLGLLSIPVSLGISKVIDRASRAQVFRYLLLGGLLLVGILRVMLIFDALPVYYAIYISVSLLDLLVDVLLWTLVSEYFTIAELEHYTPLLTIALTLGGLVGGLAVRVLSDLISTRNLLLGVSLLYGLMIIQLVWLEQSETPLPVPPSPMDYDRQLLSSLRAFPRLLRHYPIILLLAVSTGLSVQLWGMSELQFYAIYSRSFPDQGDLTGFLGLLSALFGVIELGITYFVTRPLIQKWGVSRMNLVYPITTLISFLGLAIQFELPAAIAANLNYDALYSSIAQPIQNLNYNAIPQRFTGRVRVIIDGLLYPICQAITGGLLLLQQTLLTPFQISLSGVILAGVFWGVGSLIGRSYVRATYSFSHSCKVNPDT